MCSVAVTLAAKPTNKIKEFMSSFLLIIPTNWNVCVFSYSPSALLFHEAWEFKTHAFTDACVKLFLLFLF